jgi:hypothetical protein
LPDLERRRTVAVLAGLLLPAISLAAVWALTDPLAPWPGIPPGRERRAAIAIRDRVPPFQKWGSRAFTATQLERFYAEAAYFTEAGDRRGCQEAFIASLRSLLSRYDAVDVFLLAHGNRYVLWCDQLEPNLLAKLRLVYNTGCGNADQDRQWLDLGARTYIGHPGISESPVFYFFFLRRWLRGVEAGEALAEANEHLRRVLLGTADLSGCRPYCEQVFEGSRALLAGDRAASIAGFRP